MKRCKECGYRKRGENHDNGKHHRYGESGHTLVVNPVTEKVEEKKRRPVDENGHIVQ